MKMARKTFSSLNAIVMILVLTSGSAAFGGTCFSSSSINFRTNNSADTVDFTSGVLAAGSHQITVSWSGVTPDAMVPIFFKTSSSNATADLAFHPLNDLKTITGQYTEQFTITLSAPAGAFYINPNNDATFSNLVISSPSCGGSSSSPSSSSSATVTSSAATVTSDVFSRTRATITGNTRMMDGALLRFLSEQNSGASIISRDNTKGPLGLQVTGFNLNADDNGGFLLSSMGYMDVAHGWRRVGFAELSYQDIQGIGSMLSMNGRMSWER